MRQHAVCTAEAHEWVGSEENPEHPHDLATHVVTITQPVEAAEVNENPMTVCAHCAGKLVESYIGFGWWSTVEPATPSSRYELCIYPGCWHFVEPNDAHEKGDDLAPFVHLDDGEQDYDHDANPTGIAFTLDGWHELLPELFMEFPDGKVGPNSRHFAKTHERLEETRQSVQVELACPECGSDDLVEGALWTGASGIESFAVRSGKREIVYSGTTNYYEQQDGTVRIECQDCGWEGQLHGLEEVAS